MNTKEDNKKNKALDLALSQIDKQFGKGSIMRLGEDGVVASLESIPTGAISLDSALGIGGVPRGRITEIYGPEASGKTTLALHIWLKHRSWAAMVFSLMQNTPWIPPMLKSWELTLPNYWCLSRILVNRRLRFVTHSSAVVRWMWW